MAACIVGGGANSLSIFARTSDPRLLGTQVRGLRLVPQPFSFCPLEMQLAWLLQLRGQPLSRAHRQGPSKRAMTGVDRDPLGRTLY